MNEQNLWVFIGGITLIYIASVYYKTRKRLYLLAFVYSSIMLFLSLMPLFGISFDKFGWLRYSMPVLIIAGLIPIWVRLLRGYFKV